LIFASHYFRSKQISVRIVPITGWQATFATKCINFLLQFNHTHLSAHHHLVELFKVFVGKSQFIHSLAKRLLCLLAYGDVSNIALDYAMMTLLINIAYELNIYFSSISCLQREVFITDVFLLFQLQEIILICDNVLEKAYIQIALLKNCSSEYPSNVTKNGFTSSICPVSESRMRIPSFADSKSLLYLSSEEINAS